jgi:hypothetical protein
MLTALIWPRTIFTVSSTPRVSGILIALSTLSGRRAARFQIGSPAHFRADGNAAIGDPHENFTWSRSRGGHVFDHSRAVLDEDLLQAVVPSNGGIIPRRRGRYCRRNQVIRLLVARRAQTE